MILDKMNYENQLVAACKFSDLRIGVPRRPVFFDIASSRAEGLHQVPFIRAAAFAQRSLWSLGIREPIGRALGQAPYHDALQVLGDAATDQGRGTTGSRACAIITPISSPTQGCEESKKTYPTFPGAPLMA